MPINNDQKIAQEVKLISILATGEAFTCAELAEKLKTSTTSVYRYLEDLKSGGLFIAYHNRRYSFATESSEDLRKIIYFSDDEANILCQAIESIHDDTLLKPNLRKKLMAFIESVSPPMCTIKEKNATNINAISKAIKEHRQVILHDYASPSSQSVRDRYVEPFSFTTNYAEIWCYDLEDNKNKTFKTARIGNAEVLITPWEFGHSHRKGFTDIFHMTGFNRYRVNLRMGVRAYNLLIEEYPLAENDTHQIDDTLWSLYTHVADFRGVGRFVIGLADDIEIIESQELKDYIRDYATKILDALSNP